jgi:hypothetical protein
VDKRGDAVPWPFKGCVAVRQLAGVQHAEVGATQSRGFPNERRFRVGMWGKGGRAGDRRGLAGVRAADALQSPPCVTDVSWDEREEGERDRRRKAGRGDEIGARSTRPASGSRRTLSGWQERLRAEACICLEPDLAFGRGSRRMRHETLSRHCSPARTLPSSVAVQPKPSPIQFCATSR